MKKIRKYMGHLFARTGRSAVVALVAVSMGLSGCIADQPVDPDTGGTGPVGKGGVTLNLSVPGMTVVTRGAVDETTVGSLDVIAFDATTEAFIYHSEAEILGTGIGGNITQAYVELPQDMTNFTLVLIANAPMRSTYLIPLVNARNSKSEILSEYLLEQHSSTPGSGYVLWNGDESDHPASTTDQYMPMYGESEVYAKVPSESSSIVVDMIRSLAKIDIFMDDTSSSMKEVRLMNFTDMGVIGGIENSRLTQIAPGEYAYPNTTKAEFDELSDRMYVFEQRKVDDSDTDTYAGSPHILVYAQYPGDGQYYFYRVNFTSDGNVEDPENPGGYIPRGEYIPITRNHKYTVKIKEVLGKGHNSVAEASASPGGMVNLDYTIHSMILESSSGLVGDFDGRSFLMVNTDSFTLKVNRESFWDPDTQLSYQQTFWRGSFQLFCHNYDVLNGGWTAVANDPWILLTTDRNNATTGESSLSGESITQESYGWIHIVTTQINNGSSARHGTITITSGRMSHTVHVYQEPNSADLNVITSEQHASPFMTDNDIVFYTWFGDKLIGRSNAEIYVEWSAADFSCGVRSYTESGDTPFVYMTGFIPDKYPAVRYTALTADGMTLISTYNNYNYNNAEVLYVGPDITKATEEEKTSNVIQKSNVIFNTGVFPLIAQNRNVWVYRKNYFVKPVDEYIVFDNNHTQQIRFESNTDYSISLVEYPSWLSTAYSFTAPSDQIMGVPAAVYDDPLSGQTQTNIYNLTLPTLYAEDLENQGIEEGYVTLKFKVTAKPCVDYPDVEVSRIISVKAMPKPPSPLDAREFILAVDKNNSLNLDGDGEIVFFKWGSVIAIKGGENGDTFTPGDDIAWVPAEYNRANGDPATWSWNQIPYGDINGDFAAGKGDPCALAVKTKGADAGKKFKMPTAKTEAEWQTVAPLTKDNYPFAGYRSQESGKMFNIGSSGEYWSATMYSNSNNYYNLTIFDSGVNPSNTSPQSYGYSVRCVVDDTPSAPSGEGGNGITGKGTQAREFILAVDKNKSLNLDGDGEIVYFKWGSVIALNAGNNTNGEQYTAANIAWVPAEYNRANGDPAAWTYAQIPYDDINGAFADGLGDPCKLAVKNKGAYAGKKFKTPTATTEAEWLTYGPLTADHYPFAGYRNTSNGTLNYVGSNGYYWSATTYGSDRSYYLYSTSGTVDPSGTSYRRYGFSVRCVVDE